MLTTKVEDYYVNTKGGQLRKQERRRTTMFPTKDEDYYVNNKEGGLLS